MPNDEDKIEQSAEEAKAEKEASILQALLNKGPALPVEVAVRTFSFPEEITAPLESLEEGGYIQRQKLQKGEMFVLTGKGQERAQGA